MSHRLLILPHTSKDINIRQLSHRKKDSHVRVSFPIHILKFFKLQPEQVGFGIRKPFSPIHGYFRVHKIVIDTI